MGDRVSRDFDERAVLSLLDQGFAQLVASNRIPSPDPEAVVGLAGLVRILHAWAGRINLTGHREPLEMARRLVLDAAALAASLPELAGAESLVDLGSGAGFPGLPIAILHPQLRVRLVESRKRRSYFQRAVRRELRLPNVEPLLGRAEELVPEPGDVVIAQAMTQPDQALRLMRPWARSSALIVLPASDAADSPDLPPGVGSLSMREYRVPTTEIVRRIWISRLLDA